YSGGIPDAARAAIPAAEASPARPPSWTLSSQGNHEDDPGGEASRKDGPGRRQTRHRLLRNGRVVWIRTRKVRRLSRLRRTSLAPRRPRRFPGYFDRRRRIFLSRTNRATNQPACVAHRATLEDGDRERAQWTTWALSRTPHASARERPVEAVGN